MIEMLGWAALAIAVAAAVVLVIAMRRPDTFRMARSMDIAAPPERIFPLIESLREFNRWNPFLQHDPSIRMTYHGPPRGVGAAHEWDGNRNVGAGRVEITRTVAPSLVVMRLQMTRPMAADNHVEFTVEPSGSGSRVTWAMEGRQPLIGKVMTMFIDCDRMVGGTFDRGLGDLKRLVESGPA